MRKFGLEMFIELLKSQPMPNSELKTNRILFHQMRLIIFSKNFTEHIYYVLMAKATGGR